jgi:hypothetical protein
MMSIRGEVIAMQKEILNMKISLLPGLLVLLSLTAPVCLA